MSVDLTPLVVDGKTVTPQYPVIADPAVKRNCGIVTCSWYVSVAKTKSLNKQRGDQTALGGAAAIALCALRA